MRLVDVASCPAPLLARFRALVMTASVLFPATARSGAEPVTCYVGSVAAADHWRGPQLRAVFHGPSAHFSEGPVGHIGEGQTGSEFDAWCSLCGTHRVCKHLRAYLGDLRAQFWGEAWAPADAASSTRSTESAESPIKNMLARLEPKPRDDQAGHTRLGLFVSERATPREDVDRLCVQPFTYVPAPHYGPDCFTVDRAVGFEQLSDASAADLVLLCGLSPYTPSPVVTAAQEAAFTRVAKEGLLLEREISDADRFAVSTSHSLRVGSVVEPHFYWAIGPTQRFGVTLDITGDRYTPLLCGERAWLRDDAANEYRPIAGPPSRLLVAWSDPVVDSKEADALSADDAGRFAAAGLPAPWRISEAKPLESVLERHVRLVISRGAFNAECDLNDDPKSMVGHLSVTYGRLGIPHPAAKVVDGRGFIIISDTLYELPAAEVRGEGPAWLTGTDGQQQIFKRRGKGLAPVQARGQSARAAWLNAINHMKRRGVEVVFEGGASIEPAIGIDAQHPTLMATEVGDRNVYEIGAPVEVAGESVDLVQALAPVVRNPLFDELVAGEVPQDTTWAVDLPDGRVLAVPVSELQRLISPLVEWLREGSTRRPRLSSLQVLALDDAVQADQCHKLVKLRLGIARLASEPDPSAIEPVEFHGVLRLYQREGFDWLNRLHGAGFGGVVADDMGLGKTVQALAHVLELHRRGEANGPVLVVCPTSVAEQWEREAAAFTPSLRTLLIRGEAAARAALMDHVAEHDLVITTYAQVLRDQEPMGKHTYGLMILDEAQQVKNGRSQTSRALHGLQVERTLVVTGTPVENNLGDLYAMFEFIMPGALGDETMFKRHFRTPIEKRGDAGARERLARMVAPFILRRLKRQVAKELPEKTEVVRKIEFTAPQRTYYEELRAASYLAIMSTVRLKGVEHSSIEILAALLKLRQVCDDPRLVKLESGRSVRVSSKLDALMETLREAVANGRHVLVFSCFTEMLDIIDDALTAEGITHLKFTGASRNRQSLVDRFQSGLVPVFLVSLKAGGAGLNLTAADTVIHYDPWWNPAVEDQATDRAHRIGQDKPVLVYKLVCVDTLEEHILAMKARKAALAKAILDNDAAASVHFNMADVEALLGVGAGPVREATSTLPDTPAARPIPRAALPPPGTPIAPERAPDPQLAANAAIYQDRLPARAALYALWERVKAQLAERFPAVPVPLSRQAAIVRMTATTRHIGVELRRQARPAAIGIYICFWDASSFPIWQALSENANAFNAVAGHTWEFGRAPTDRIRWIALERAVKDSSSGEEDRIVEWLGKELDRVYRVVLPYVTASGAALDKGTG